METFVVLFLQQFEIQVYYSLAREKKVYCTYMHNTYIHVHIRSIALAIYNSIIGTDEAAMLTRLEWLVLFAGMHLRCTIHLLYFHETPGNLMRPTPSRETSMYRSASPKSTRSACPQPTPCTMYKSNTPPIVINNASKFITANTESLLV